MAMSTSSYKAMNIITILKYTVKFECNSDLLHTKILYFPGKCIGSGKERIPRAGLTGEDPGKERNPGAAQTEEGRTGPKEGSLERATNPGTGPGNPGAIPEKEI